MFGIFGEEVHRYPGHFPWRSALTLTFLALLVLGTVLTVLTLATGIFSGKDIPVVQPEQQAKEQPLVEEPQTEGPTLPAAVTWPKLEVEWMPTGVSARTPNDPSAPNGVVPPTDIYSTLPTEEGFYSGHPPDSIAFNPNNHDTPDHESAAFTWRVLPQFTGLQIVMVAAVRDGDITFAWIREVSHLLLSVNGEKSWCELNHRLPTSGWAPSAVRIQVANDTIHLYAQDSTGGMFWWTTTIEKSALPCS